MATATMPRPKAKRLWTYDEMLARLSETNQPIELWDGEIVISPSPHPSHQEIVFNFARLLRDYVSAQNLGKVFISPLDVVLSPRRVVQPDLFFVSLANRGIIQDHVRGVPDLVVEVISEGSWRRDRIEKKALYEQFSLPEYWIVDPESRTIEVFALAAGVYQRHARAEGGQTVSSKILPDFSVSFNQLEV